MKAVTIEAGQLQFRPDHPAPQPVRGEVLVNVVQAGICETDLQITRGYMEFSGVLGHEFLGVIDSGSRRGQRVAGEINCPCRQCDLCRRGLGNHCPHRTVLGIYRHDGAFAEQIAVPEANLHALPDSISDDEAVFVEPLAAAAQILEQVDIDSGTRVAILGDGRLAYLCAQVFRRCSERLCVVGKHEAKLERFRHVGVSTAKLDALAGERSWDVVVDCTGSATGLSQALTLVRPRGTVVMKTTVAAPHQLSLAPLVIDEVQLVGSRCGPFDKAIELLAAHEVSVAELITDRYPLDQAVEAFQVAESQTAMKVILDVAKRAAG